MKKSAGFITIQGFLEMSAAWKKRKIGTQPDIFATSDIRGICKQARDQNRSDLFATAEAALHVERARWLLRTTSRMRLFRCLHAMKSSQEHVHEGVRKAI